MKIISKKILTAWEKRFYYDFSIRESRRVLILSENENVPIFQVSVNKEADMGPTIHDVARIAGVSKSTVSRAYADPDKVKEPTRNRIFEAAASINYTPNALARAMKTKRTGNIGFIICDKQKPLISNPFYAPIVEAVVDGVNRRGNSLFISSDIDMSLPSSRMMMEKKVDGVILASQIAPEMIRSFREKGIPVVLLNNLADPEEGLIRGINDDYQGARDAMEHLIRQGHERIAMISGLYSPFLCTKRHQAYLDSLKEHGLEYDERIDLDVEPRTEDIMAATNRILTLRERPTALFCNSDVIAVSVMKVLLRAGLTIPGDIAVVGYDNSDYCQVIEPELSSVHVDKEAMGRLAVDTLFRLIAGESVSSGPIVTETTLMIRQSG
jgi:DNA-binding LacI/PurR family transcriptional regulator